MKKLLLVTTITALTMTSIVTAPKAQAANIAQSVCEYVAADDKKRMRSFLKSKKLKIRNIFSGVKCNGQNLLEFAATKGSIETGSLMISKLPKKNRFGELSTYSKWIATIIRRCKRTR